MNTFNSKKNNLIITVREQQVIIELKLSIECDTGNYTYVVTARTRGRFKI